MEAAARGDKAEVERLIEQEEADPCYQREADGVSALMMAAANGHKDVLQLVRFVCGMGIRFACLSTSIAACRMGR